MKRKRFDHTFFLLMALMALGYLLLHDLLGGTLFAHSAWDSYSLQTAAWLRGEAALMENYSHLELALYAGKVYVSFPPVPSVALLPFVLIFGAQTPNNLIIALYAMAAVAVAYRTTRRLGASELAAAFWALFAVWGSNLCWMSTSGGVWFQAQALNLLLCFGAVSAALKNRRSLAYLLLALAVGCRPFSACFFPALAVYFYITDRSLALAGAKKRGAAGTLLSQWKHWILPMLIAAAMMWYNWIRFDNPLEFGHNYLPEFLEAPMGQFSLSYLPGNLLKLFFSPVKLTITGQLSYSIFNSFAFYIANPIFLVFFVRLVRDLYRRTMPRGSVWILVGMVLSVLLLCLHRTLGGWQFGARYMVDLIPFVLMYLWQSGLREPSKTEIFVGGAAILFNLYGALAMTVLHG